MSRNIANRDNGSADEYGHLLLLTRLFGGGGVAEGLKVVAATSPNMTVIVSQGSALIPTGTYPSNYAYDAWIDTTAGSPAGEVVTIGTASASNPRIDAIVKYVDKSVTASSGTPNNTNNMLKVVAVAGTPNASPAAPGSGTIQSAIGAGNPYIQLATVLVGTSVTSISNTNITDTRVFATVASQNLPSSSVLVSKTNTSFSATTLAAVTGLSAAFTAPATRQYKVSVKVRDIFNGTATAYAYLSLWDGTVGSGTQLDLSQIYSNGGAPFGYAQAIVSLNAGDVKTYNVGLQASGGGTAVLECSATAPAQLLIEPLL